MFPFLSSRSASNPAAVIQVPKELVGQTEAFLASPFQVFFLLLLQQFIELVVTKNTPAALLWIEKELLPKVGDCSLLKGWLNDVSGLLAYQDPANSPLAHYLDKNRHRLLADCVNSAICSNNNTTSTSTLEGLLKHTLALHNLVSTEMKNGDSTTKHWLDHSFLFADLLKLNHSSGKTIKQD